MKEYMTRRVHGYAQWGNSSLNVHNHVARMLKQLGINKTLEISLGWSGIGFCVGAVWSKVVNR